MALLLRLTWNFLEHNTQIDKTKGDVSPSTDLNGSIGRFSAFSSQAYVESDSRSNCLPRDSSQSGSPPTIPIPSLAAAGTCRCCLREGTSRLGIAGKPPLCLWLGAPYVGVSGLGPLLCLSHQEVRCPCCCLTRPDSCEFWGARRIACQRSPSETLCLPQLPLKMPTSV